MFFSDIIGHANLKEKLLHNVNTGRLSHAQLFSGLEGSGNLGMAMAMATYILCTNKQQNDSCGTCAACIKNKKLVHPDLHLSFPIVTKSSPTKRVSDDYIVEFRKEYLNNPYMGYFNWLTSMTDEVKNALITTEEGSEIIKKLSLKTYESEYKILLMWFPEKMNVQTANKLLKILEEPPEKTLFLLVSEYPEGLLPTIISRVQKVHIPVLTNQDIELALTTNFDVTAESATFIANFCEGNYNLALEIINSSEEENYNLINFQEWMRNSFIKDKQVALMPWIDKMASSSREKQKEFLSYCMQAIRKNLLRSLSMTSMVKEMPNETSFNEKFHNYIHAYNCGNILSILDKAVLDIDRNGNSKMIFLDCSLQIKHQLSMKVPVI
jgi:DNA polymerase-3 subunit delta'